MTTITLDPLSLEILSDLFHRSLNSNGLVDALSYRVDHEDWIERLTKLEHERYLVVDGGNYRISFVVLTLLDDQDAKAELDRCEKVFSILREHFKNPSTRNTNKRLSVLAMELDSSYEQTVRTIRYLLDVSGLWAGAWNNNWVEQDATYVTPNESIIRTRSFDNLVSAVQKWFEPHAPQNDIASAMSSLSGVFSTPPAKRSELHPAPIVTSFLYELKSDAVTRIVCRAGLAVDWTLTDEQSYSDKTRLRAYLPRIEAALSNLNYDQRLLVARNLTHGLLAERTDTLDRLNTALGRIGWKIVDGDLTAERLDLQELFFPSGAEHAAYIELRNILQRASRAIFVVDPYLDGTIFTMLKTVPRNNLHVRLLTNNHPSDFKLEAKKFEKETNGIQLEIRTGNDFHDRFIILDEAMCFHIGASIKDAGRRAFMISQLEDKGIVDALLTFATDTWKHAVVI